MANFLAQSAALAFGKTEAEARIRTHRCRRASADRHTSPHKVFAGNQPSTTIILPRLDAFTWVCCSRCMSTRYSCRGSWGINSFDQWGSN